MSGKPHDGGPAFPQPINAYGEGDGMTLRDYFAAKAMQGMYAGNAVNTFGESGRYAEAAYQIADAMLAERAK